MFVNSIHIVGLNIYVTILTRNYMQKKFSFFKL